MVSVLSQDIVAPSIPILHNSGTYTGPKLNNLKANYAGGLKNADLFLTLAGFIGYAKGTIPEPNSSEPHTLSNWHANDAMAATLITSTIETAEWEYIDCNKGAVACWSALQNCHQSKGPIRQVQLLQEALTTQCTKSTLLPITADRICTVIDHAYNMGDISKDLLKCIALLGSLGCDFPHLHSIIICDISVATAKNPLTSVQLCSYLDGKQTLLNLDSK